MQTADFRLIDNRLADLDSSLAHPEKEALALLQDSVNEAGEFVLMNGSVNLIPLR